MHVSNGLKLLACAALGAMLIGCNESANLGGAGGGGAAGGGGGAGASSFSVSGTISIPGIAVVDSDTNNSDSVVTANSLASPQAIPNPAVVSGHVNQTGAGAAGNTNDPTGTAEDIDDFFAVNLLAGQVVTLSAAGDDDDFGNTSADDVDLVLLDATGNIIESSVSSARFEQIRVPADGDFIIQVHAQTGSSTYVLNVGLSLVPITSIAQPPTWVKDQIIVKLRDNAGLQALSEVRSVLGEDLAAAGGYSLFTVDAKAAVRLAAFAGTRILEDSAHPAGAQLRTLRARNAIRKLAGVEYAELNYINQAFLEPNDDFFPFQWHYSQINLPTAWDNVPADSDVIVAVIDTGITAHPDLANRLVPGFDFISDVDNALDGDGIDSDPTDEGDLAVGGVRSSWHGTHVAGTVAAQTNNNLHVAGTALNARVMPLRVLGRFGGTDFDILQALLFAAGLPNDSNTLPANPADVINMSLGRSGASPILQDAIDNVRAAGTIVVAAAGNASTDAPAIPASLDGVISVSAATINRQLAPYSNFGTSIDVTAPGGDFSTDLNGDGFPDGVLSTHIEESGLNLEFISGFLQGTSMAAPHVAGVLALMKSVNPGLTPADIDSLLIDAGNPLTVDLGTAGRDDQFGNGLIDAAKAVAKAAELVGSPVTPVATVAVTPPALNFGSAANVATLLLSNPGGGSVTGITLSADQPWIAIDDGVAGADGFGNYIVTVDRAGQALGTHSATITINSSVDAVGIPVVMQVVASGNASAADLGRHYVSLIDVNATPDPGTGLIDPTVQVQATASGGAYSFSFGEVPPGTYFLTAGTDHDNDFIICDAGEACGAFPSVDGPISITVGADTSGLSFDSSVTGTLRSSAAGAAQALRSTSRIR